MLDPRRRKPEDSTTSLGQTADQSTFMRPPTGAGGTVIIRARGRGEIRRSSAPRGLMRVASALLLGLVLCLRGRRHEVTAVSRIDAVTVFPAGAEVAPRQGAPRARRARRRLPRSAGGRGAELDPRRGQGHGDARDRLGGQPPPERAAPRSGNRSDRAPAPRGRDRAAAGRARSPRRASRRRRGAEEARRRRSPSCPRGRRRRGRMGPRRARTGPSCSRSSRRG